MSGDDLETIIRKYIEEDESRVDWPCWELNDHDAISSQGDFGNFLNSYPLPNGRKKVILNIF